MATELSIHIKNRRMDLKLAQGQLATIVGVSRGTIRNVESGNAMEESTQRGLERVLGWLPNTTTPFVQPDTMTALSQGLLTRMGETSDFDAIGVRAAYHAFLSDLARGAMDAVTADRFYREIIGHLPAAAGNAAWRELTAVAADRAKGEGGDVRTVQATSYGTMASYSTARRAPLDDGGSGTDRLDATARPETVGAIAQIPSRTIADEMHIRAYQRAQDQGARGVIATTQMEVPKEIITPDGPGYLFVVAPLPEDVVAEMERDDVEALAENLRDHGVQMARDIVAAKRRALARNEAQREGAGE